MSTITRSVSPLEEILTQMQQYGKLRLGMYGDDGTWHCNIVMHINAVGGNFKIASEFSHNTPLDAAIVCYDRMRDALRSLGTAGASMNLITS